jgi:poly(A) polymerase
MAVPPRLEDLLRPGTSAMVLTGLFEEAGHELYLVGGSVRDALLDRDARDRDLDFATSARPDEIRAVVGEWADSLYLAGQDFGTVAALKDGEQYEITTFRSEVYREESRKPQVTYSDDIVEDLSRRDFTVNAMALHLSSSHAPEMIDPHGGLADLGARVLRTPLEPSVSFGDDPLRMLRLYRFASTLGFEPQEAAISAVRGMRGRLAIISAERIRDELDKLITGPNVGRGLWGLLDSKLADEFIPEVPALALEQDPLHHHKDVLAHTVAVVEKTRPGLELRLAALFHDIGKPETRAFGPGGVSFHHHEVVGARMARRRMKALRYSKRTIGDVGQLVFLHMRPHTYKMGWTDSAVRRYVRDAGPLLDDLNELVRCDVTTRNRKRARTIERRIDELEERITLLRREEELDALRPPIDGRQVMEYLGLEPGPTIGVVMDVLYEHRIEHGPYSEEEAHALLDAWRREQDQTEDDAAS